MRSVKADFAPSFRGNVARVVSANRLGEVWRPDLQFVAMVHNSHDIAGVERLRSSGVSNVSWVRSDSLLENDVIVGKGTAGAHVLYRASDLHHAVMLTNRCNSYCLMCSQPPTPQDDAWLQQEAVDVIRHIAVTPSVLGVTGGEPLLVWHGLRNVLDEIGRLHPGTIVEILTNGRELADEHISRALLADIGASTRWLVPLYGHADFLHDFVVQSQGAFEQTLQGLLELQRHGQRIQLRVVLIRPVLDVLPDLCTFIGRNLPFVDEVALMACEPIGFALANRDICEVDLREWTPMLLEAGRTLRDHGVRFLFMNTPLCCLPEDLRPHAHRSISDWKNTYDEPCETCSVRSECSGLFTWHSRGWKPSRIEAIPVRSVA